MDAETARWAAGIALVIVFGLLGLVYRADRSRDEEQNTAFEKHRDEDAKVHERVTRLESEMLTVRREIGDHDRGMIGQLHRYSKAIRTLYAKLNVIDKD